MHNFFSGFHLSTTLILVGLLVNTIASIIVLIPNFKTKIDLDDDLIIYSDNKTQKYTQRKHIKARKNSLLGFTMLTLGFILQVIGVFLQIKNH